MPQTGIRFRFYANLAPSSQSCSPLSSNSFSSEVETTPSTEVVDSLDAVDNFVLQQHFTVPPMRRPARTIRARRPGNDRFRLALIRLRSELGWTQETLAQELSVSPRTLSNWENGYWLPPFRQRIHIVVALRDAPPEQLGPRSRRRPRRQHQSGGRAPSPLVPPGARQRSTKKERAPGDPVHSRADRRRARAAIDPLVRELADEDRHRGQRSPARGRTDPRDVFGSLHATLAGVARAVAVKARKPAASTTI